MPSTAIVDASALYASIDSSEPEHAACLDALQDPNYRLVIPMLAVTEASYLIESRLGTHVDALFIEGLARVETECPTSEDWARIAELMRQYADWPLGAVDASLVALAERLDAEIVITLDRRHFSAVRPRHRTAFRVLPGSSAG